MKIILIAGQAQHGKDTTARLYKEELERGSHKVLIAHYADFLKDFARNCLGWNGVKDESGRTLLQHFGTNVVRANNPNTWVNMMIELIKGVQSEYDYVIIPDTRFPNEVELMKQVFDTKFVKVVRFTQVGEEMILFDNGLTQEQKSHESETALVSYVPDLTVINDGDVELLRKSVISSMEQV